MGNHQFGFIGRSPEFIGRGWSYVTEKRKSNNSKLARHRHDAIITKSRSENFCQTAQENEKEILLNSPVVHHQISCPSQPQTCGGTPKLTVKRGGSVKRTRSMLRCSPTIPDALTLSLDVVNTNNSAAQNNISPSGGQKNNDVDAVLSAIQKLQPAAPRLFKKPSFDEFFEEAERRNQTMEALQAALIVAPSQQAPEKLNPENNSENLKISPSSSNNNLKIIQEQEKSFFELTQQKQQSAMLEKRRSPQRLFSNKHSTSKDVDEQKITSINNNFSDVNSNLNADSVPSKGRLVVIVGGETTENDHNNTNKWERLPPTIIVQPEDSGSLFVSPSTSCLVAASAAHTPGLYVGRAQSDSSASRRNSMNPSGSASPQSIGVRFADEQPSCFFVTSDSEVPSATSGRNLLTTSFSSSDERRVKRRSSLRRKTIGGVAYLRAAEHEVMSAPDVSSVAQVHNSSHRSSYAPPTTAQNFQHQQQRPLRKKSLSKSDLLCEPPIISLLKQPQINLVRQLWLQLYTSKGPTVLGNHVFQRVFLKNVQVKEVFRNADVGNQHVNVDAMCKTHAKAVANILDDVVRHLDNLHEIDAKLTDVGRRHAIFHDLGFHINFWTVFAEAFIDCTLEWGEKSHRNEEARKAWAIIITYITDKMKLGYQEERRTLPRAGRRLRVSEGEPSGFSSS